MFAPHVAEAGTKAAGRPTFGSGAINQAPVLLTHRGSSPTTEGATPGVSWDFSKIPRFPPPAVLQPKLVIGDVNDPLESEADAIADRVMRGANASAATPSPAQTIRRKCSCESSTKPCPKCGDEKQKYLRRDPVSAASHGVTHAEAPPIVHEVLRSPGQPLDGASRSVMESRFGYDLGHIRIHADSRAAESANSVQARAYTIGHDVVFAAGQYNPASEDKQRLLAHELAHVEQQHHVSGRDGATIRRYTEFDSAAQVATKSLGWVHPGGSPLRVSDDGKMAAEDNGWGEDLSKRAWTTPANLVISNAKLAAAGSKAKLVAKGNPISGTPPANPKAPAITLQEVEPVKTVGAGPLELASDCGSACKEVMGSPAGGKDVSVMKSGNSETYGSPKDYHGGDPTTPEEWTEEVYKKEFGAGLNRSDLYKKYAALSPAEKDKFDRKYGRNKYARPEVGQGITISTEKDAPGSHNVSGFTWNFHYAAAVISSGVDYVTLENAAGWKATGWIFFMYGPASKAQSFLEEQAATLTHGSAPSAAVVESENVLDVATISADAPLLVGRNIVKLASGTALRIVAKNVSGGQTWLTVEVKSGPKAGTTGQIRSELVK